jgi:hypothetical protein
MSASNVKVGGSVKVDVLVPDGGSGLYPQAKLYGADNIEIGVSPLDLSSVEDDLYSASFTMPDTSKVTAITTVYTDSGHTTPSADYDPIIDEYLSQNDIEHTEIPKNTAFDNFSFPMYDEDGELKTGLTVTARRSIDGSVMAACTNAPVEVGEGLYTIDFSAADLNGDNIAFIMTANDAVATTFTVVTE